MLVIVMVINVARSVCSMLDYVTSARIVQTHSYRSKTMAD